MAHPVSPAAAHPHRQRRDGRGHRGRSATAPTCAWRARSSPRYAESMTYKQLGYSVIGMTNMPEAKLAREAEICYATVAMVTDFDCWHPDHDAVTVQDIIKVLTANAEKAKQLVARLAQGFPARARAVPDRLRPRARHRADHRARGARPGADEEARRGGGTGAEEPTLQLQRRECCCRSIAKIPPPTTAPMIPKMTDTMITAGIAAKRPFDHDRHHPPERNVDIGDRDAMRRGRRLNGHGWLPGCAGRHGWPDCRTATGFGGAMRIVDLDRSRARNGARAC